jgi:hypothetical protein
VAYEELKQRQSVMWGNGTYQLVTETLADIHEAVVEALAPAPGDRLPTSPAAPARSPSVRPAPVRG